jgi:hypothetical protein
MTVESFESMLPEEPHSWVVVREEPEGVAAVRLADAVGLS